MVIKCSSRKFNYFIDTLIYDGHITAISAAFVFSLPLILFNLNVPFIVGIIPFVACEIIYSFNRYKEKDYDSLQNYNKGFLKRRKIFIPFFLFLVLILFGCFILFQRLLLFLFSFAITLIGILYSLFVKDLTKLFPGIKNFFVSFSWGSIAILSFMFYNDLTSNYSEAFIVFFFVFINVLLFEIFLDFRDKNQDIKRSLATFPIILKREDLIFLMLFINFLSIIPIFAGFYFKILQNFGMTLLFAFLYNFIFIAIVSGKIKIKSKFFEPLVDSAKILWIMTIIASYKFLL